MHSKICLWRFLFCHENLGIYVRPGAEAPSIQIQYFLQQAFPLTRLFQNILSRENWRDGGGLLFKVGNLRLFKVDTLDTINGH